MSFEKLSENIKFPEIASKLRQMYDADQTMRGRFDQDGSWNEELDVRNTERMKEIVAEIGWPTISKVGKEGAGNAWLLVQHADHDVEFQERCLELMRAESESEVNRIDIAYLEDRVRVNRGRGQLYGTQFTQENNKHIPMLIEDEDRVDERRAAIGMGPLSEQIQQMYERYPFKGKE